MDTRSIVRDNIRDLFNKFNNDFFFQAANVILSKRFDHFIDRLHERKFDEIEVIKALKNVISDKKCEIIYCCHLKTPPLRLNIIYKNFIICFSIFIDEENNKKRLQLRTITEKTNKYSRISTFILQ